MLLLSQSILDLYQILMNHLSINCQIIDFQVFSFMVLVFYQMQSFRYLYYNNNSPLCLIILLLFIYGLFLKMNHMKTKDQP
jgi:uncharacterized integral membrane protein